MLRLSFKHRAIIAALAATYALGSPAQGQPGPTPPKTDPTPKPNPANAGKPLTWPLDSEGKPAKFADPEFSDRLKKMIDDLEDKRRRCLPIDVKEYEKFARESNEAMTSAQKATKQAAKAGAPVNEAAATEAFNQAWVATLLYVRAGQIASANAELCKPPQQAQGPQPKTEPAKEDAKSTTTATGKTAADAGGYGETKVEPPDLKGKGEIFKPSEKPAHDSKQGANSANGQSSVPSAPLAPQPAQTLVMNLTPFARGVLTAHNAERSAFGVPPLQWDPALEQSAKAYAELLARTGQLAHAPREGRGIARENLSQGMLGWTPGQMMRNWLNEKRNFKVGIYPDVSTTGRWDDVSHYTQMIWPTTTDIGCGMASGSGFNWLVCRYSPGGNKDGKPVIAQGFQAGAGIEGKVAEATHTETPPTSKLDPDLRVRQDWGAQMISEQAKAANTASTPEVGFGSGIYWDPVNQVTIGVAATYVDLGASPVLIKLFGDADLAYDDPDSTFCRIEPGVALNYDLGAGLSKSAYSHYIISLSDELADEGDLFWAGVGVHYSDGGHIVRPVDTKVEQPDLRGKPEVFDPAAPSPIKINLSDCVM